MNIPTTPGTLGRARNSQAAIVRRIVAVSALGLTVFGLGVSVASAGESETISRKGGSVSFRDKGERLVALDQRKDGLAVRAYLQEPKGSLFSVTDPRTDGSLVIPAVKDLGGVLIQENTPVRLWMCYVKFGVDVKCSNFKNART
jgi:hypothetical protein